MALLAKLRAGIPDKKQNVFSQSPSAHATGFEHKLQVTTLPLQRV
jgi:hypothetical protein